MVDDGQVLVNLGMSYDNTEWQPYWDSWIEGLRAKGWRRYGLYVWDQGPGLPGNCNGVGRFAASFELIFHFNQRSRTLNKMIPCIHAGKVSKHLIRVENNTFTRDSGKLNGTEAEIKDFKIPDSTIRVTRHKGVIGECGDHPAVFPVALPELIINAMTQPGEWILEPFAGSGTQFLAADNTGRSCAGIELAPAYVDVAIARWKQETGQEAILAETGEPFSVVQQRRVGG
jgi:DNA modification methylase